MKEIKFSVLMSVYYKEKPEYLKAAIDSVLEQTLPANEIVLVEDGPLTEELYEVIEYYKNNYDFFKVVKLEKNVGLGNALNIGLKNCSYDYVARMDTDDICLPNRFEVQINYLKENPNIDIIGSNMIEYDEEMKNVVSKKIVPETHIEIIKYSKSRNPMNHPTIVYKKNKVLEVNSYEDYLYFEDYYLWAKMIKNGCVFYNIQKELYKFRAGSSMFKRRGGLKYLKCIKKMEKGLLNLGLINKIEYYKNILIRYFISLSPNFIRTFFYKILLRGEKNEI